MFDVLFVSAATFVGIAYDWRFLVLALEYVVVDRSIALFVKGDIMGQPGSSDE